MKHNFTFKFHPVLATRKDRDQPSHPIMQIDFTFQSVILVSTPANEKWYGPK